MGTRLNKLLQFRNLNTTKVKYSGLGIRTHLKHSFQILQREHTKGTIFWFGNETTPHGQNILSGNVKAPMAQYSILGIQTHLSATFKFGIVSTFEYNIQFCKCEHTNNIMVWI